MSDSLIHLQSAGADIVIKTRPFAEIVYWGPHLSHFSPQDADSLMRPVANGRLDVDSPVTLMAELGHGLFGAPGIEGHRQGLDASPLFTTSEVRHEGQTLTLVSEDPQAGLRLRERDRVGCQRRAERAPWRDQSARQPMAGGSPGGHAAGRRTRSRGDGFPWPLDPRVSASPPDAGARQLCAGEPPRAHLSRTFPGSDHRQPRRLARCRVKSGACIWPGAVTIACGRR